MEEYFSEIPITNSKTLCIGPITRAEAESGSEQNIYDGLGYYIFVADTKKPSGSIDILAKIASPDAANQLMGIFLNRLIGGS